VDDAGGERAAARQGQAESGGHGPDDGVPGTTGFWDHSGIVYCRDGKARRVEPGIFPLADGVSGRVGLLRGAGNAIVPQVAAAFIRAYLEAKS